MPKIEPNIDIERNNEPNIYPISNPIWNQTLSQILNQPEFLTKIEIFFTSHKFTSSRCICLSAKFFFYKIPYEPHIPCTKVFWDQIFFYKKFLGNIYCAQKIFWVPKLFWIQKTTTTITTITITIEMGFDTIEMNLVFVNLNGKWL